jgi:hypothetical protein
MRRSPSPLRFSAPPSAECGVDDAGRVTFELICFRPSPSEHEFPQHQCWSLRGSMNAQFGTRDAHVYSRAIAGATPPPTSF